MATSIETCFLDVEYLKNTEFYKYNCQNAVGLERKLFNFSFGNRIIACKFLNEEDASRFLTYVNSLGDSGYFKRIENIVYEDLAPNYFLLEYYDEVDDKFLISKDGTTLVGVKNILNAIENNTIQTLEIPKNITTIAASALNYELPSMLLDYKGITKVICNDELKVIGQLAFSRFPSIEEVILNEGLEIIQHGAFTFNEREKYLDIVIPTSVIYIGKAFGHCNVYFQTKKGEQITDESIIGEEINVYYKGMWEYNEEGLPVVIEKE